MNYKHNLKSMLAFLLSALVIVFAVIDSSGYGFDGNGAIALDSPDLTLIPGGAGGEEPASAGGPITSILGIGLLLGGFGAYVASDFVGSTEMIYEKMEPEDKLTLVDKIMTGAINFKNEAVEFTGEAFNWVKDLLFGESGIVTETNPALDPNTGLLTGSLTAGIPDVYNFWTYTGVVWSNTWLNEIPTQLTFSKTVGMQAELVSYNGVQALYSINYLENGTCDYSVTFEIANGDIFEFYGNVEGVSSATEFGFKKLTKSPDNDVWIPFRAAGVKYVNIANNDYTVRKCRYNNQQIQFDPVSKRIFTMNPNKTYLTQPNQFTSYLDFLNKTVWSNTNLIELPYTIDPNNWINDNPVPSDGTKKVVVPVPGQTVNPNIENNPYQLPDGNSQTAANNLPDVDPNTVTVTETGNLPEVPPVDTPIDPSTDKLKLPSNLLMTKFPFSLPADLYSLITVFDVPVKPMIFTIPFDLTSVGLSAYNLTLNLSGSGSDSVISKTTQGNNITVKANFDKYLGWIRFFVLLAWIVFLMMITRSFMK